MIRNKDDFKTEYKRIANTMFRRDPEHLDDKDKFAVLARLVAEAAAENTGREDDITVCAITVGEAI